MFSPRLIDSYLDPGDSDTRRKRYLDGVPLRYFAKRAKRLACMMCGCHFHGLFAVSQ